MVDPRLNDDSELLRRYVEQRSQDAFTTLVERHVNLVYFTALRRVGGDAHLADDVTQRVFADLAHKAASLKNHPTLTGWLYTSTRFTSAQAVRSERRRKNHEQEADAVQELHPNQAVQPDWNQLRPLIDEALDDLSESDREAVLLRYFENQPFAEVAARFALTPDAARMRVDRALEKLRTALARRGIVSTAAALGAAFATQAVLAAPVGLTQKAVSLAFSQGLPATTIATAALWKIAAGVATVSIGLGAAYMGVQYFSAHPSSSQSATIDATPPPVASLPTPSLDHSVKRPVFPAGANSAVTAEKPHPVHRTTDEFGWPRVGLFAVDHPEKPGHTVAEFRAKMKSEPEFLDAVLGQARDNLDLFYGRLFRALQLTPEQLDTFKNLLVEKERIHNDVAEAQLTDATATHSAQKRRTDIKTEIELSQRNLDAEIRTALGDARYASYLQYRNDLVQWTVIDVVARKLESTATPLTENQTDQLLVLLRSALLRIRPPNTFDLGYGAGIFCPNIGAGITARVLKQAEAFLSPPQVEALRQLQKPRAAKE